MTLATYKDLCFDASDAHRSGTFWAAALGLTMKSAEPGVVLVGPTPAHTIWIDPVPEPKSVKHRVHLDIHGASVDELVALGAAVVDADSFRWNVMVDPEGAEFCLFVRDDVPAYRLYEVGVDCADHRAMSAWWQSILGGTVGIDELDDFSWVENVPNAPFDGLVFCSVPESKTTKNRVHMDIVAPAVEPIVAAGASLLRSPDDDIRWHVLADPEGNEFCVFDRF